MCETCRNVRENNPRWHGYEQLTGVFLTSMEYFARKRGLEWSVTPEYLWQLWEEQQGRCFYTGLSLEHGRDASLDRRDNAQGYVVGNVQWVHRDINRIQSDFPEARFLELCVLVATESARKK